MGEGVERHATLQAGQRVAAQVGHPGVAELMQADRDDQQDELKQAVAKRLGVHLSCLRSRHGAGRSRRSWNGRDRTSVP